MLRACIRFGVEDALGNVVRAQYGAGAIGDGPIAAYRQRAATSRQIR